MRAIVTAAVWVWVMGAAAGLAWAQAAPVGEVEAVEAVDEAGAVGAADAPAGVVEAEAVPAVRDLLRVELESPRATMFTFLRAMGEIERGGPAAERAWPVVEQTLSVGALPAELREPRALQRAARALLQSLDKIGTVEAEYLPDAEAVRAEGIRRFTYFPGRLEQQWVWEELRAFDLWPAGSIVLREVGPGEWRFTAETVATAPALAESLQPLPPKHFAQLDDLDEEPVLSVLGETFALTPWWGWLALLGCIFGGLVAGKLASTGLRAAAERWRGRGWRARAISLDAAASPASLALLTLGLAIGLHTFIRLDDDLIPLVTPVIQFLYLIALGWLLYNLVDAVELGLTRFTDGTSNRLDDMIVPLVRKSLRVFIVVVFFLVVAQNVFGLNITGWLAGLGIAGLAVSLAAQDSVKNLFGSLTVFFDKPFVVGDFITYGGYSGTVEEIGFRSTRIRLLSGHLVTVPNMKWIDSEVENIAVRPYMRRELNIGITYDTPPAKIEEAVRIVREVLTDPEVVESGKFDMEKQAPQVSFNEFNADSLNIKAFYWWRFTPGDPSRGWFDWFHHCQVVNLKLFARFAEAGIEFAFPTQTLYLANDDKRQLAVRLLGDHPMGERERPPAG